MQARFAEERVDVEALSTMTKQDIHRLGVGLYICVYIYIYIHIKHTYKAYI